MKKKALALFLAALLAASAVSCGKKDSNLKPNNKTPSDNTETQPENPIETPNTPDAPTKPIPNKNAGLSLSTTEHAMKVGDTYQITATFVPEYDTDSTVLIYTVSDTNILTVDDAGLVSALTAGEADITVENENGKFKSTLKITVTEAELPPSENDPKPDHTEYLTLAETVIYQGKLVLINKQHSTPAASADTLLNIRQNTASSHLKVSQYKFQISAEALDALSKLADDYYAAVTSNTKKDILVSDAHRTPEDQQDKIDQKVDDTAVGHSDFQTGLSVNLKFYDGTFTHFIGDSTVQTESAWLNAHYAEYGFILRYPEGKTDKTGYESSKSHFRYVGVPHSVYIKEKGLCLEEYIELIKGYTMENPLKITVGETKYSVYYIASQGQVTTLPIPSFDRSVDYSVSGNNLDGFIVTVAAQWASDAFDPNLPVPNENPGITLDITDHTLTTGDTLKLNPIFVPLYNTDNKELTYLSSNPKIATVENGVITALSEGEVTITVQNCDGKYTATCKITVSKKAPTPNPDAGITLNETEINLKTGDYFQLVATFIPQFDSDNRMLIYSSSDSAVTVDGTGKIFAKEVGTVTITVKDLSGSFIATCTVNVEKGMNVNAALTLDKITLTLEEGCTDKITATFIPKYDTDDTTLTYITSDDTVLLVDTNGTITALKSGTATVTVQNSNGEFTAVCTVTVTKKPLSADPNAGITLDKSEIKLSIDETGTIKATFVPEFETDNRMLIYSSSDPDLVSVNGLGEITAHKAGIATITVKNYSGKYTAVCTVYVPNPAAGISVEKSELTMTEGTEDKIEASFIPEYETDSTILTYTSSDTSVVTVDENGNLTAFGQGTAIITVTCGKFNATITVTVNEKSNVNAGLTLEKTEYVLEQGNTDQIIATLIPEFEGDDTTINFQSSDYNTVSVDENGIIIALKPGTVTITVVNGAGKYIVNCTVTVTPLANPDAGITLENDTVSAEINTTAYIKASFIPLFDTDDTTLIYTIANPDIATVTEDGTIIGVSVGTTTVVIRSADGNFEKSCTVIITESVPTPNPNAGITLNTDTLTLHTTNTPYATITATVIPEFETDDTSVTFESSDSSVITVDQNGVVTAVSNGKATVTVKSGNLSATCTVTVTSLIIGDDNDSGYGEFVPYS